MPTVTMDPIFTIGDDRTTMTPQAHSAAFHRRARVDPGCGARGMQQAKRSADCERFDDNYVFSTNGHRYGEFDCPSSVQTGLFRFADFSPHADLTARSVKDNRLNEGKIELPAFDVRKAASAALSELKLLHVGIEKKLQDIEQPPQRLLAQAFGDTA